ncbi:MAG: hypothetical protein PHU46_08775 [Rhodocyclaceae bacterium]|nr:hypothetical protein [Rhodocyclaceae bacterium]
MDTNAIFRKTHKGLEEIERRTYRLPPRERLLLIQVDGKRSLDTLAGKAGLEREGLDTAARLLSGGFIEVAPNMAIKLGGQALARQDSAPSAGYVAPLVGGSVPHAQPHPQPPYHSPHPATPASRPAPAHSASPSGAPPRHNVPRAAQTAPADARTDRRSGNWLTSTVAHLTNLFTASPEYETPQPESRATGRPHQPAATPKPADRGHAPDLAATVIREPVIDLTAAAEPSFAATGTARRPIAQAAAKPARQKPTADEAMQALLAATAAQVAVVDLTAAHEPALRDDSSLAIPPGWPAHPVPGEASQVARPSATPDAHQTGEMSGRRLISTPKAPVGNAAFPASADLRLHKLSAGTLPVAATAPQPAQQETLAAAEPADSVACPQRSTCPGCPRCPGNSVSLARNFMKQSLQRFTGQAGASLEGILDQCRTLVELQRQFEPWLRNLLLTAEGVMEAPGLAAKLQRMLLQ